MKMKKGKRKPGPPGRETVAILLRIDPSLADWLATAASETDKSRSKLMESWLASLRAVVVESERAKEQGLSPFAAVEVLGAALVGELVRNGFATEFIGQAWREHLADQQRKIVEAEGAKHEHAS